MKLRVLGCHGGELPKHRTTCFLIDGVLALDRAEDEHEAAPSGTADLDPGRPRIERSADQP